MQNASNQMWGDPWLKPLYHQNASNRMHKKGFDTNFETRPRTASIFALFLFFFTDLSNVILFLFLQSETRPAAQQNTFYES